MTRELKADLALLSVTFFWGITFLMVQDALKSIDVFAFLFYRFLLATILMFFVARKLLKQINRDLLVKSNLLGVFLFLSFALQTFALIYAQSSIVAFITGLSIVIVPFLIFFLFRGNVRPIVFLGSLVALAGLYMLTMSSGLSFGKGEFLTLCCALFIALHLIYTDKYSKIYDFRLLVFYQLLVVSVLSLLGSLFFEEHLFRVEWLRFDVLQALFVTAFFATFYAYLVQTSMQQYTTPTKTAVIFSAEPVFAFFYGYFVGEESFTLIQVLGCLLIVCAVLIVEIRFKKK